MSEGPRKVKDHAKDALTTSGEGLGPQLGPGKEGAD